MKRMAVKADSMEWNCWSWMRTDRLSEDGTPAKRTPTRMIVDSSILRDQALETFLQSSPDNYAVISEVTGFESYKGNPVRNASHNYEICSRFPRQILILRCVRDIIDAERDQALTPLQYVDPEQTAAFGEYCRLLARAAAGDVALRLQLAAHGIAAAEKIAATRAGVGQVIEGIREMSQSFGAAELSALRSGRALSQEIVSRTLRAMLASAAASLTAGSDAALLPPFDRAVQTFAFRYGVAGYALALWWITNGNAATAPDEHLCNDMVDMQQVAFATRFDGLLTRDAKLEEIFQETRICLSAFEGPHNET
jgi:hypothetical protein